VPWRWKGKLEVPRPWFIAAATRLNGQCTCGQWTIRQLRGCCGIGERRESSRTGRLVVSVSRKSRVHPERQRGILRRSPDARAVDRPGRKTRCKIPRCRSG
jgi:hypothetical protein